MDDVTHVALWPPVQADGDSHALAAPSESAVEVAQSRGHKRGILAGPGLAVVERLNVAAVDQVSNRRLVGAVFRCRLLLRRRLQMLALERAPLGLRR